MHSLWYFILVSTLHDATVTSLPLSVIDYFTVVVDEGTHMHTLAHLHGFRRLIITVDSDFCSGPPLCPGIGRTEVSD